MSASLNILVFLKKNILQLVALTVLFLLLVITWFFFQKKNVFPEGTHIAIQEEFQNIVRNKLLKKILQLIIFNFIIYGQKPPVILLK